MNWNEIIKSLNQYYVSLHLAQPNRRLSGLNRIDGIMKQYFKEIVENPSLLKAIPKEDFKSQIASAEKVKELNGAEKDVINKIYDKLGL